MTVPRDRRGPFMKRRIVHAHDGIMVPAAMQRWERARRV
jgi:hypothetical protein